MGAKDKTELAEDRTDYAEDRTLLANERTYGNWIRTALTAAGIAIAFHALFRYYQAEWIAKGGATIFIVIAVAIIILAHMSARAVDKRMESHQARALPRSQMRILSALTLFGAIAVGALLWII